MHLQGMVETSLGMVSRVLSSNSSSDTCQGVTLGKSFQFVKLKFHHLSYLKVRVSGHHETGKEIKYDNGDSSKGSYSCLWQNNGLFLCNSSSSTKEEWHIEDGKE